MTTQFKNTHNSIPKPLYEEVKTHLQDMINRGWRSKLKSPQSFPVVCVREKDGSLRLCVNYRQLKCKIEDDCQPIPRIQGILNSLSGDTYFSVLDQGKPYDQDIMTMILCQEGFCCSPTSWLLRTCWKPFRKGITWKALFTLGRGNTCNSGTHIYRPSLSSKPKHDRGKQRVLQWNLFLPCDVLPLSKQSLVKDHPIAI